MPCELSMKSNQPGPLCFLLQEQVVELCQLLYTTLKSFAMEENVINKTLLTEQYKPNQHVHSLYN